MAYAYAYDDVTWCEVAGWDPLEYCINFSMQNMLI